MVGCNVHEHRLTSQAGHVELKSPPCEERPEQNKARRLEAGPALKGNDGNAGGDTDDVCCEPAVGGLEDIVCRHGRCPQGLVRECHCPVRAYHVHAVTTRCAQALSSRAGLGCNVPCALWLNKG
jgi:hypothetical protein